MDNDMKNSPFIEKSEALLPRRDKNTNKTDYGRILIAGGCVGYTGAPTMCARAALRAGAGLVYLGVPSSIYDITAVKNDEAMPFPLPSDADGRLSYSALPVLAERLNKCAVGVIGPGLGRSNEITALVGELIKSCRRPLLLDADGLFAVSRDISVLLDAPCQIVVTPHEGEFVRMGGKLTGNKAADALAFSMEHGCVTVLKGPETAAAFPDGEVYVSRFGNPGMAVGGSGDVLSGIIGGLMGQLTLKKAVLAGLYIHGAAGDACARRLGEYSMLPGDIIETMPQVMKELIK